MVGGGWISGKAMFTLLICFHVMSSKSKLYRLVVIFPILQYDMRDGIVSLL